MLDLHISWPSGEVRLSPGDSPVLVGRSSTAAVPLTHASVSRQHLELSWDGVSWQVTDTSTHGTYDLHGVRRPERWTLDDGASLRLGGREGVRVEIHLLPSRRQPTAGDQALVTPAGQSATADAGADASPWGPADLAASPDPAGLGEAPQSATPLESAAADDEAGMPGPTGTQPAIRFDPSTPQAETNLHISVDGQNHVFRPGTEVTVGRDPSCAVHLDERHSLVSRRHLRIVHRDDAWWIEDFSSKGSWVDQRRLRGPYRARGNFVVHLGDDDAGTPMRVMVAGRHRPGFGRNGPLIAGLAVLAIVPMAILGFLIFRGEAEPDLETAKQATVALFGANGGQGSGFFVADNLILTNQHVAALSPQLLVAVSRQADEPANIEYATELVANHPYLDIAVLRVSNRAEFTSAGAQIPADPVGNIDLPSVILGDSSAVSIGDEVFSTGFPDRFGITGTNDMGELRLPAVVATSGEVLNFGIWPGCSNPDLGTYIPTDSPATVTCADEGDVERGVLLSAFASGRGASGSPVFRDNKVVGVVYAGAPEEDEANLNIATSAFLPWLEEIVATNG